MVLEVEAVRTVKGNQWCSDVLVNKGPRAESAAGAHVTDDLLDRQEEPVVDVALPG
jgi:hypothetical protein